MATVARPGYFNAAAMMLRTGDLISINAEIPIDVRSFQAFVTGNNRIDEVEITPMAKPVRANPLCGKPAEAK